MDSQFDAKRHCLVAPTSEETGGLIKKQSKSDDSKTFKKPSASLLGLDKLAQLKREAEGRRTRVIVDSKRPKYAEKERPVVDDDDDDGYSSGRVSFGSSKKSREKYLRTSLSETPSHTGGANEDVLRRIKDRRERDRKQGLYTSSKGGDREIDRKRLVTFDVKPSSRNPHSNEPPKR